MTFSRFVCWQKDRVFTVMNTQAEYAQDDVFLAVHSNYELTLQQTTHSLVNGNTRLTWSVPPEQFLKEFLAEREGGYQPQAVVLGGSGSGKSHLIHWLKTRIPSDQRRYVLTIPKAGTSLRGVIRMLLDILPAEQSEQYRKQLQATGQHETTTEGRRDRLIAEIGLAIARDRPRATAGEQRDLEEDLISRLPAMFRDAVILKYWMTEGSTISRLAAHIEEQGQSYERLEQQRAFTIRDLPLAGLQTVEMSRPARELLNDLRDNPDDAALAVDIINRNLDDAIVHVLNFTGDELFNLMIDIRRYLRRVGKELVLLIEDFARVQGVDRALLQALIELPGTGPDALCTMRWAMAVTNLYFEQRLPDTVKTRITHTINMDVPQDALGVSGLDRFAARYLNAARLPAHELETWHTAGANPEALPNPCTDCAYRPECHPAFGDVDGVGLYPFNSAALHTMAERKNPDIGARFNPRSVVGSVLAEVLDKYAGDLEQGAFPPDLLLRSMGGSQLPQTVELRLQQADPESFLRQRATLELWGTPGTPVALSETVYQAFDLAPPKIALVPQSKTPQPGRRTTIEPPVVAEDPRIVALRAWAAGRERIGEVEARPFKELLYDALESYIDWDAANLWQTTFAARTGGGKAFAARHIFLRNQLMNPPTQAPILLQIPLVENDDTALRQAAIALEGLYRFKQHGSWEFEDGQIALVALSERLEAWAADVIRQLRALPQRQGEFPVVQAAIELLAVGATLCGRLGKDDSLAEAVNALFAPWPPDLPAFCQEWRGLYREILKNRENLVQAIRSLATATKGGRAGPVLDSAQIRRALRQVRISWELRAAPPPGVRGLYRPFQEVADLHTIVRARLVAAARAEQERRISWLNTVRSRVPEQTRRRDLVDGLKSLQALVAGVPLRVPMPVVHQFNGALAEFEATQFDAAVLATSHLRGAEEPLEVFPQLGKAPPNAVDVSLRFFEAADRYLLEVGRLLDGLSDDLTRQAGIDMTAEQERIETSFARLDAMLSVIGGAA